MFRMLILPSSGACDLFVELFHGLYCSGSMCVGVTLWFGCGGVVSVYRLKQCFIMHYLMFIGTCIILIVEERETNLMSLPLLFLYLMLNMFRTLIHPSSGVCDLFVELFHGLYYSGSMCAGVALWYGCGDVVSVYRLSSASSCIRIPHHHSHTTTQHQHTSNQSNTNHEITQQISRKLLRMDVLTSETC